MNGLALCAGVGGLELGLGLAIPGYRCVGYVEREAHAAATLVARMEDQTLDRAPVWDDLQSFDGRPWRGLVDLVSAGFPCQDISTAGTGAGLAGERSGLWFDVLRIIRDVGPRVVFLENVSALTSRGLDTVLAGLAQAGLDAEWGCFRADLTVAAPHRRERIFILAWDVSDPQRDALRDLAERGPSAAPAADCGDAEPRDVGEDLGDPDRQRLLREREPQHAGIEGACGGEPLGPDHDGGLPWPPGPSSDRWPAYLAAGGPEPAVRRGSDGDAPAMVDRAARLHGLGNGVVPVAAAYAFVALAGRALR